MHKTTVGVEKMLQQIIRRLKKLKGRIDLSPPLDTFVNHSISAEMLQKDRDLLEAFCLLDDYDILGSIKVWYPLRR